MVSYLQQYVYTSTAAGPDINLDETSIFMSYAETKRRALHTRIDRECRATLAESPARVIERTRVLR